MYIHTHTHTTLTHDLFVLEMCHDLMKVQKDDEHPISTEIAGVGRDQRFALELADPVPYGSKEIHQLQHVPTGV